MKNNAKLKLVYPVKAKDAKLKLIYPNLEAVRLLLICLQATKIIGPNVTWDTETLEASLIIYLAPPQGADVEQWVTLAYDRLRAIGLNVTKV